MPWGNSRREFLGCGKFTRASRKINLRSESKEKQYFIIFTAKFADFDCTSVETAFILLKW